MLRILEKKFTWDPEQDPDTDPRLTKKLDLDPTKNHSGSTTPPFKQLLPFSKAF
jgi:hypothetical protein